MKRTLYEPEHKDFAESFRAFLDQEVVPHYDEWEKEGIPPRDVFRTAAEKGFLGIEIPEEYGGVGVKDFRFQSVINEEANRKALAGFSLSLTINNDIVTPYFLEYCTDEQKERWLPGLARGELLNAIAMSEPEIGSDLAGMKTTAIDQGDHYLVNGSKTFITSGIHADLIVTAVKTDPKQKHSGMSLLVIEREMDGFERGRNLEKIGQHSQDTAELFFNDVAVPKENLLGEEGMGFKYLVHNLPQERLSIAIHAVAAAEAAVEVTSQYVRDRSAFGSPIGSFQNTRFELAECKTKVDVGRTFVDQAILALNAGELSPEDAAGAKMWCTAMACEVTDRCLQLFGGYGYMTEYPISRLYSDTRVLKIYGGTSEIMKEIVGRSMQLA